MPNASDLFALRYFRWALAQLQEEAESLERIGLVQDAVARNTTHYLRALDRKQRLAVMTAMIKRFHPRGAALAGNEIAAAEQKLLEEKDRAVFEAGLRMKRREGPGLSPAGLRAAFRDRSIRLGALTDDAKAGAKIEMDVQGWRVRTVVAYTSEPVYIQVVIGPTGKYLQDGISVLSWFGVSGQSAWHLAPRGTESETADQIARAADLFVLAAPELLASLN